MNIEPKMPDMYLTDENGAKRHSTELEIALYKENRRLHERVAELEREKEALIEYTQRLDRVLKIREGQLTIEKDVNLKLHDTIERRRAAAEKALDTMQRFYEDFKAFEEGGEDSESCKFLTPAITDLRSALAEQDVQEPPAPVSAPAMKTHITFPVKITVIDNKHPNGIPYEQWVRSASTLEPIYGKNYEDGLWSRRNLEAYFEDQYTPQQPAIEAKIRGTK